MHARLETERASAEFREELLLQLAQKTREDAWTAIRVWRYLAAATILSGPILDLGSELGIGTWVLGRRCHSWVVGGDLHPQHLAFARESFQDAPARFVALDAVRLPFRDSSFRGACVFSLLQSVTFPETVLDEVLRVLTPDGTALISNTVVAYEAAGSPGRSLEALRAFPSSRVLGVEATESRVRIVPRSPGGGIWVAVASRSQDRTRAGVAALRRCAFDVAAEFDPAGAGRRWMLTKTSGANR